MGGILRSWHLGAIRAGNSFVPPQGILWWCKAGYAPHWRGAGAEQGGVYCSVRVALRAVCSALLALLCMVSPHCSGLSWYHHMARPHDLLVAVSE